MLEQGYNSQLPKYQLTASTIQGPATKAGSAEQQSHIQQLSRKTKQKDHCFFSCRLGLGKQWFYAPSPARFPCMACCWYPQPSLVVCRNYAFSPMPVLTSAVGNRSQLAKTGELLLANCYVVPLADYELHRTEMFVVTDFPSSPLDTRLPNSSMFSLLPSSFCLSFTFLPLILTMVQCQCDSSAGLTPGWNGKMGSAEWLCLCSCIPPTCQPAEKSLFLVIPELIHKLDVTATSTSPNLWCRTAPLSIHFCLSPNTGGHTTVPVGSPSCHVKNSSDHKQRVHHSY